MAPIGTLGNKISSCVAALLVFAAINIWTQYIFRADVYDNPAHNLVWWKVQGYRSLATAPDVVLLGSSLMYRVTTCGEAHYRQEPVDPTIDHQCKCLQDTVTQLSSQPISTFAIGLHGAMISDYYALTRALMTEANHPKVVVLGIGPRDFLDNRFPGLLSSQAAQYTRRFAKEPLFQESELPKRNLLQKAIQDNLPLYTHKEDFLCYEKSAERNVITYYFDEILHRSRGGMSLNQFTIQLLLGDPQELLTGQWAQHPKDLSETEFKDNSDEYRIRYLPYNPKNLAQQLGFLDRLIAYCSNIGTSVIIVNMPLLPENLRILPAGVYQNYLASLSQRCHGPNTEFWDLNNQKLFSRSDFNDTVHLNGSGSVKLERMLATKLAASNHHFLASNGARIQ
jgi:hypothetical protein